MNTHYTYQQNLGIIPFLMKAVTAGMFGIVIVKSLNTGINKAIIIACGVYFAFALYQFLTGLKNRPLKLSITGKGVEYTYTAGTIDIPWKNIKQVNEYFVPVIRRNGYFRIDIHSIDGEVIWLTNNILLSTPPKSFAANYNEVKRLIKNKIQKEKIKFQVTEF